MLREQTARMASTAACAPERQYQTLEGPKWSLWLDAIPLLESAFHEASKRIGIDNAIYVDYDRWRWAEAEALLRTGWTPDGYTEQ